MSAVLRAPELRAARWSIVLLATALAAERAGLPPALVIPAYLGCYLVGGWQPARDGLAALRAGRLDVDALMVVAAVAAAGLGQWLDGALLIVIFTTSGGLEELATSRTARGVRALLDLAPDRATRLTDDGERIVPAADLAVGQRVLVRPGERLPADGTVIAGASDVDEASITGEPLPAAKAPGTPVFAGAMNGTGVLTVEVARAARDSVVSRIVAQVEQASASKAPTQLFIERLEQRYSAGVVVATVALVAVPLLLGQPFAPTLLRAMTFMIVASPCGVVLATMPPLLSAIATASRHGVLVRGGTAMERLGRVRAVAFDKTGTLTQGAFEVAEVVGVHTWEAEHVLALAAAAERGSEHPAGRAIAGTGAGAGAQVEDFRALPGRGVEARVGGRLVRVGNDHLCVADPERGRVVRLIEAAGRTPVLVDVDGAPAGVLALADRLRHGAPLVVRRLRRLGIERSALLTGDRAAAAAPIARACGIDEVHAGLLPEDKVARVRALQAEAGEVLVVGDGVNDAPALAAAELGAAMGKRGADLALETADVVLVTDVVTRLPAVIELSQRANRVVRQNLALAAGLIVVLAGLTLAGHLSLPVAVAAHEGSTLLIALHGLRLLLPGAWPARRACGHGAPTYPLRARPQIAGPAGSALATGL